MKRYVFILLVSLLFMTSCQNNKPKSSETTKPGVENKFYFVEFVDSINSTLSQNLISLVKSRIYNKGYVLTSEVIEIDTTENAVLNNLSMPYQYIHRFRDLSEYISDNNDPEKIVITYNKPLNDSIPNFNFHSYKKLGHPEWQSVFNPGNFRFSGTGKSTEKELADWMVERIVGLTFK